MAQWTADYQMFKSSPEVAFRGNILICNVTCDYKFQLAKVSGEPVVRNFQDEKVFSFPVENGGTITDGKGTTYRLNHIMFIAPAKVIRGTAPRSKGQMVMVATGPQNKKLFISVMLDESKTTADQKKPEYKIFQKLSGYIRPQRNTSEHGKISSIDLTDLLPENNNYYLYSNPKNSNEQHLVFQTALQVPAEFINSLIAGLGISLRQFTKLQKKPIKNNPKGILIYFHGENARRIYREPGQELPACEQQPITGDVPKAKPGESTAPATCPGPQAQTFAVPEPSLKSFWETFVKFLVAMTFAVIVGSGTLYGAYKLIMKYCWFYADDLESFMVHGASATDATYTSNKNLAESKTFEDRRTMYRTVFGLLAVIYLLGFILLAWNNYDLDKFWTVFRKFYTYIVVYPISILVAWATIMHLGKTGRGPTRLTTGVQKVLGPPVISPTIPPAPTTTGLAVPSTTSTTGLAVPSTTGTALGVATGPAPGAPPVTATPPTWSGSLPAPKRQVDALISKIDNFLTTFLNRTVGQQVQVGGFGKKTSLERYRKNVEKVLNNLIKTLNKGVTITELQTTTEQFNQFKSEIMKQVEKELNSDQRRQIVGLVDEIEKKKNSVSQLITDIRNIQYVDLRYKNAIINDINPSNIQEKDIETAAQVNELNDIETRLYNAVRLINGKYGIEASNLEEKFTQLVEDRKNIKRQRDNLITLLREIREQTGIGADQRARMVTGITQTTRNVTRMINVYDRELRDAVTNFYRIKNSSTVVDTVRYYPIILGPNGIDTIGSIIGERINADYRAPTLETLTDGIDQYLQPLNTSLETLVIGPSENIKIEIVQALLDEATIIIDDLDTDLNERVTNYYDTNLSDNVLNMTSRTIRTTVDAKDLFIDDGIVDELNEKLEQTNTFIEAINGQIANAETMISLLENADIVLGSVTTPVNTTMQETINQMQETINPMIRQLQESALKYVFKEFDLIEIKDQAKKKLEQQVNSILEQRDVNNDVDILKIRTQNVFENAITYIRKSGTELAPYGQPPPLPVRREEFNESVENFRKIETEINDWHEQVVAETQGLEAFNVRVSEIENGVIATKDNLSQIVTLLETVVNSIQAFNLHGKLYEYRRAVHEQIDALPESITHASTIIALQNAVNTVVQLDTRIKDEYNIEINDVIKPIIQIPGDISALLDNALYDTTELWDGLTGLWASFYDYDTTFLNTVNSQNNEFVEKVARRFTNRLSWAQQRSLHDPDNLENLSHIIEEVFTPQGG